MRLPRVLVVDDSAFARTLLSRVLRSSGRVDVVGTARDGADALDKIASLDPDVVSLDLTMPHLDGLSVLRALGGRPRPRVIVVSVSSIDTELGVEALALGAVDLVAKPTALASDRLAEISDELIDKITAVAPVPPRAPRAHPPAPARAPALARPPQLVMIGTSTGGPQALTRLVSALPPELAVPVAIVLHIPAGYTQSLAARLDRLTGLMVVEASDGLALRAGSVILARGGSHLRIRRRGGALVAEVSALPARPFTPSVDDLFASGAEATGGACLGIVLTGMGDDGLIGARAIAAAGGSLITESEETCVVYGMPRVIDEAGLGATSVPLDQLVAEIVRRV